MENFARGQGRRPRTARSPEPRDLTAIRSGRFALLLLVAGAGGAQVSPNGPQFQVNGYTSGGQSYSDVAADGEGRFVVAWASFGSHGTDASESSIQVRRFRANGLPFGEQLQVNSHTPGLQSTPAVAIDPQGNFLVVWISYGSSGTDASESAILGRRLDENGLPVGEDFQINTYTTGRQWSPDVAADDQGSFVVVWTSRGSSGTDSDSYSVQAQRFGADGVPLGGEFQVNTLTTSYQVFPAVAGVGQGGFVVAWQSLGSSGTDDSNTSIQARRYDASGAPLGVEFQVNTYTTSDQGGVDVAADGEGSFVVAWGSDGSSGDDSSSSSVQAQRYDADGTPVGGELQVNSYTTGSQGSPRVAIDDGGRFVVTWLSLGSSGGDSSYTSVQAQRYLASGLPVDPQFQVNSYTTSYQMSATVAADGRGDFVVSWTSDGSGGTDTEEGSIQAQRYDGLFRDGFEGGDAARWSLTAP